MPHQAGARLSESPAATLPLDANDKLLLGGLLAVLGVVLVRLGQTWWSSDSMSHGFLVPVVSLFVASSRSRELAALPASSDRRGVAALALALIVAFAGYLAPSMTVAGIGVVGSLVALLWFRRGTAWVAALTFPLAYLLFAVPPPQALHDPLVVWAQNWSAENSVRALYQLHVPVYLDGYIIQMAGGLQVEVAEACSGVTSLYTLSALATLLAYLSLKRRWTRIALVALVLPAALIGNLARVSATVLLCLELGLERATTGWVHTALGLLIYVVAVGLLLLADAALRRSEQRFAA
jgi:exosortase